MRREFNGIGMTSQRTRDRLVRRLRSEGIMDEEVLNAIAETPRHIFVDEALSSRAYEDTALPIGQGQTISQPYIVARMTEALLGGGGSKKVLEVGTGCGYQTAVLAQLVEQVYSIERIERLLNGARERFHALGLNNVRLIHGDGIQGWKEYAPYDAIMVTAAPDEVPEALYDQLAPNGRLVIPIGPPGFQQLLLITSDGERYRRQVLNQVIFVPLLGGRG